MRAYSGLLDVVLKQAGHDLQHAPMIQRAEWQAMDTSGSKVHETPELRHVVLDAPCPQSLFELQELTGADQPWAALQFEERVSGEPWNPGETYKQWPYHKGDDTRHRQCCEAQELGMKGDTLHCFNCDTPAVEARFSHTYGERYFPKFAGRDGTQVGEPPLNSGIRFEYGDLNNLVHMLRQRPLTRQAYLPVWFPEDLYAADVEGERVPCTLGYHFLSDGNRLDVDYFIRSCDYVRHLRNDIYMTCRLLHWICEQTTTDDCHLLPGRFVMHIGSLHYFLGDQKKMEGLA